MDIKKTWKKVWHFIWEEDSFWSWVVSIVLAFVIIKFLVYPGLGLVLGTQNPIVAVVSGSMEHDGSFEEWWNSPAVCKVSCTQAEFYAMYNITKDNFLSYPYNNGFNIGDIMILFGTKPKNIRKGDILVFNADLQVPIIHRVINKWEVNGKYYFTTKGDHNTDLFYAIGEDRINENQVIGRAVLRIPWLGYIKIWFVDAVKMIQNLAR